MKRTLALLLAAVFISIHVQAAVLTDSKHNFTDNKGNDGWYTGTDPCSPCHYPDVSEEERVKPQWDAEYGETVLPAVNTEMFDDSSDQMSMMTKICIGCHDGTIAQEVLGSAVKSYHVNIWYDQRVSTKSNGEIVSPSLVSLPLYDGRVDCPTCHDPHSSLRNMLRVELEDSKLCLECHNL